MGEGSIRAEPEEGRRGRRSHIRSEFAAESQGAGRWSGAGASGSQDERPPHGSGVAVPGDASSLPKGKGMTVALDSMWDQRLEQRRTGEPLTSFPYSNWREGAQEATVYTSIHAGWITEG